MTGAQTCPPPVAECLRSQRRRHMAYCEVAECERLSDGHGPLCSMHAKRKQRGQSLTAPITERLTPKQRALETGIRLLNADSEDDAAYASAERAFLSACRALGGDEAAQQQTQVDVLREIESARVKEALALARARGVRLGRPPSLTCEQAAQLIEATGGNLKRAAQEGNVSRDTLRRALRTCGVQYRIVSHHSENG